MVIVCGIDGSATSREAARAAAAVAKRTGDALRLVHVQEAIVFHLAPVTGATPIALTSTALLDAERARMQTELSREGERLAEAFGIEVTTEIRVGMADLELDRSAREIGAGLVVVASLGHRSGSVWRLGSTADRLAQTSSTAVLVVREARAFERWARDDRPLQAVLALDASPPSEAAVRATSALRRQGPCDVVEVHVYDPSHEAARLGLTASEEAERRTALESVLARELPGRFGELGGQGSTRFVALPSRAPAAEALADFVDAERPDLLIVGAHGWGGLHRRVLGSVSFGVLPLVDTNVLVVHAPRAERAAAGAPVALRRVLVATDLSETGNRAVEHARAVVRDGGQLVLLHVLPLQDRPAVLVQRYPPIYPPGPEERRLTRSLAEAELKELLPSDEGLETEVDVVESDDVPTAILQAAERHDADLVCLGTHGRGPVTAALMGSVARVVARRSPRPVLLVPHART